MFTNHFLGRSASGADEFHSTLRILLRAFSRTGNTTPGDSAPDRRSLSRRFPGRKPATRYRRDIFCAAEVHESE